jgi:hypothetical protein
VTLSSRSSTSLSETSSTSEFSTSVSGTGFAAPWNTSRAFKPERSATQRGCPDWLNQGQSLVWDGAISKALARRASEQSMRSIGRSSGSRGLAPGRTVLALKTLSLRAHPSPRSGSARASGAKRRPDPTIFTCSWTAKGYPVLSAGRKISPRIFCLRHILRPWSRPGSFL